MLGFEVRGLGFGLESGTQGFEGWAVMGLGFRVYGLGILGLIGLRDQGLGFRDQGLGFRDQGLGFRGEGLGLRDQGLGFGVLGSGSVPCCQEMRKVFTRQNTELTDELKTPDKAV